MLIVIFVWNVDSWISEFGHSSFSELMWTLCSAKSHGPHHSTFITHYFIIHSLMHRSTFAQWSIPYSCWNLKVWILVGFLINFLLPNTGLFLCVGIKIQKSGSKFFVYIFCSATLLVQISYLLLQTHIITSFWFFFFLMLNGYMVWSS
jgi:hypothetical protein